MIPKINPSGETEDAFLKLLKNAVVNQDLDSVDILMNTIEYRTHYMIQSFYECIRQNSKSIFDRFMKHKGFKSYICWSRFHYVAFNIAYECGNFILASHIYDTLCKNDRQDADKYNPGFLVNEMQMFEKYRYRDSFNQDKDEEYELCVACNGEAFDYDWNYESNVPINTKECLRCKGYGYEKKY